MKKNLQRGYSLIELLVVLAIISALFVAGITFFGDSRKKARDARRLQDIEKIQQALEIYYNRNGHYPLPELGASNINNVWADSNTTWKWDALGAEIGIDLPVDPLNTSGHTINLPNSAFNYAYFSHSTAYCRDQGYVLHFNLEHRDSPGPELTFCNSNDTGLIYLYDTDGFTTGVGKDRNIIRPSVNF